MDGKRIDRRNFLGAAGTGLFAAGAGLPLIDGDEGQEDSEPKLIYRTLGRTKLRIPVVSFGVMNSWSGSLVRKAVDMGVRHLDTAHVYLNGHSEKAIGNVLSKYGMRDKVYVATKVRFARDRERNVFISEGAAPEPLATKENFDHQLNISLKRLKSDYVDILYLHSCYSPAMATFEPMMSELVKAKESGKARFIGVSTHSNVPEVVRAAVDAGVYDVVQISYNYLAEDKEELRAANKYAAEKGVGIIAMKVMGGNRLNQGSDVEINHKAALKWVLNDENVCTAIPGMTNFDQLDLNMSVMEDLTLTEDEKRELRVASLIKDNFYCRICRSCVPACPRRVEIPNLMRAYMYAEGYGNDWQAQRTVAELPRDRGIEACRECGECTSTCRNGIPIHDRIRALLRKGFTGDAHLG